MPKTKATKTTTTKPDDDKAVKTSLVIRKSVLTALRTLSKESGFDMSSILDDALSGYLQREAKFSLSRGVVTGPREHGDGARREFVAAEQVRVIQERRRILGKLVHTIASA